MDCVYMALVITAGMAVGLLENARGIGRSG